LIRWFIGFDGLLYNVAAPQLIDFLDASANASFDERGNIQPRLGGV
jgi:hypothetical protein